MTQLLTQGSAILATGPFDEQPDAICAPDAIFPKSVLAAWQIVEVDLPADFTPVGYAWNGSGLAPATAPAPAAAKVVTGYMAAVQRYMDETAMTFGYDSLLSVVSYADEAAVPRYQTEGQAFRAWRSKVWVYCEQVKADVDAGKRTVPTSDQLIAELPALGIQSALDA